MLSVFRYAVPRSTNIRVHTLYQSILYNELMFNDGNIAGIQVVNMVAACMDDLEY